MKQEKRIKNFETFVVIFFVVLPHSRSPQSCLSSVTVFLLWAWSDSLHIFLPSTAPTQSRFLVALLQVRSQPSRREILLHLKLGSWGHFYRYFGVDNAVKNLQSKCAPFSELFRRCICQIGCFLHLSFCQWSVLSWIFG